MTVLERNIRTRLDAIDTLCLNRMKVMECLPRLVCWMGLQVQNINSYNEYAQYIVPVKMSVPDCQQQCLSWVLSWLLSHHRSHATFDHTDLNQTRIRRRCAMVGLIICLPGSTRLLFEDEDT